MSVVEARTGITVEPQGNSQLSPSLYQQYRAVKKAYLYAPGIVKHNREVLHGSVAPREPSLIAYLANQSGCEDSII